MKANLLFDNDTNSVGRDTFNKQDFVIAPLLNKHIRRKLKKLVVPAAFQERLFNKKNKIYKRFAKGNVYIKQPL